MTTDRPSEYLVSLVRELCKLPHETEWVEFKVNEAEPQQIGEHVSALANSASRLIREAEKAGAIKPFDEEAARKLMKYLPFWA
jgi:hypothetical protein